MASAYKKTASSWRK